MLLIVLGVLPGGLVLVEEVGVGKGRRVLVGKLLVVGMGGVVSGRRGCRRLVWLVRSRRGRYVYLFLGE